MSETLKIIIVTLLPALFWASSDVFSRFVSDKINPLYATVIVSFSMFIAACLTVFFTKSVTFSQFFESSPKAIGFLLLAGFVNGAGWYFFFRFLQGGGNFTQGMPMILVFIALITATSGILIFGDTFSPRTFLGFICGALAIYLLS